MIDVSASLGLPLALPVSSEFASNSEALNLINCSSAWAAGHFGKGVTVAILDAGIAPHPLISGKVIGSFDAIVGDGTFSYDPGYHPDHALGVASIVSGCHSVASAERLIAGVAPEAKLLNIRCTGNARYSDSEVMRRGILWAVSAGAKVIIIPVNGPDNFVAPLVMDALSHAKNNGVVSIIIGGNFHTWGGTAYALAAKHRLGLAVGNYDVKGGCPFPESNVPGEILFPWVMANSSGVFPTYKMTAEQFDNGGSSFAGPYVAGLAALIFEKHPTASPDEVVDRITSGARLL
ncbi:S8/S53 family peptidase [Duganella dendranthematis]|uniref:S8/S53 family peptidase n=1 Tax=Duganella dendranthematis TaxID=2728021 RepID=A0ABX6MBE5_9BURK|nr:S8/S53 family peptidase [Duganella dendranthematis]QJD91660.1 S8/S53 family peptidase [Duganella dendranthematis]